MKLDILAIAVHPDDAELSCSGTLMKHIELGHNVGILDLTKGELGTRGTIETRRQEAADSAKIIGLHARENVGLADGFFENNKASQVAIIKYIRKYQPDIILANAVEDRHPDHGRAGKLIHDACFLSGLQKIETELEGQQQTAWRPSQLFHYIQDRYIQPDFVVDISPYWERKLESIKAFKTQFFDANSGEPETYISGAGFLAFVEARSREMGHQIGVDFGEGFVKSKQIGISNLMDVI